MHDHVGTSFGDRGISHYMQYNVHVKVKPHNQALDKTMKFSVSFQYSKHDLMPFTKEEPRNLYDY